MAITKIWNIAKSKDGNLSNSLHRSLLYIVNPTKTDGGVLVGGVNVMPDAELAYEQMCETKQIFGKELGRQGYHVVLSCPVGEGDPQTMYQLTQEFIEEYLGDRYEALFAVHVDKGHLHSHIVFNSVSMMDGYKYQYTKGDWKNIIQPITNRLCEKYGLSVIPAEYVKDSERMNRGEYEYQKSIKEVMLGSFPENEAATIRQDNTERLEALKNRKKELNHELKLADSIITESMYQSYLRLEFEPETNKDRETDPLHPAIPESPWEKERKNAEYKKKLDELLAKLHADEEARKEKERKELVEEQERKRKLEADKRRMEAEKEQKTRKLHAYSRWQLDANDKFYEAVGLPASEEYAGEYLTWMSEQMSIKQEKKPLEYFERMLPSYDEYVREKYPEIFMANAEVNKEKNPASDNLTEVQAEQQLESQVELYEESQIHLQIESQPVPQVETKPKPQATPQLPASFFNFKSLPVSTQTELLCTELCDTMQVFEQLQQYANDTGYHGSFDELYEMSSVISEENSRLYEDRKAQMIADELIRAGATAQNFYQIKIESLAEAFGVCTDCDIATNNLICKVERKIGVEPDNAKNLDILFALRGHINKRNCKETNRDVGKDR